MDAGVRIVFEQEWVGGLPWLAFEFISTFMELFKFLHLADSFLVVTLQHTQGRRFCMRHL